jgi:hypothetical protein
VLTVTALNVTAPVPGSLPAPESLPAGAVPGDSGDPLLVRVASASSELDGISQLPPAEAVTRFGVLHDALQAALSELDEG